MAAVKPEVVITHADLADESKNPMAKGVSGVAQFNRVVRQVSGKTFHSTRFGRFKHRKRLN